MSASSATCVTGRSTWFTTQSEHADVPARFGDGQTSQGARRPTTNHRSRGDIGVLGEVQD